MLNDAILNQLKEITPEEQVILAGANDINRDLYNLNHSSSVDAKRLLKSGRLIELRTHTRFVHFPSHSHNYVEVVYMCSGQTTHYINGTKVVLKEGELLFLSQHAVQEIEAAGEDDIAVNFIILPEFFDKSLDMLGIENTLLREFIVDSLKNENQNIHFLHFQVADVLPIQNLVENLIWMLMNRQPFKRSLDATTMGLLFLHLTNFTGKLEMGQDHQDEALTLRVLQFVEENYKSGELSELADELHYSIYQLSRIIKNITGKNYTDLVQEKRLSQAAYLLKNTNLSITDISLDVGYHNFSYFYRIFRKQYGVTPRELRKDSSDDL